MGSPTASAVTREPYGFPYDADGAQFIQAFAVCFEKLPYVNIFVLY